MSKTSKLTVADRLSVFSRVLAAAFGGYALTSAATVLLALVWPAPRAQAVLWGTMLSFAVYTTAVILAFTTRSATRAWLGMAGSAIVCAAAACLLKGGPA